MDEEDLTAEKEGMAFNPGGGTGGVRCCEEVETFLLENGFSNFNIHMCHLVYCLNAYFNLIGLG